MDSCRVTKASSQSLTTGVNTVVSFDTAVFDNGSLHDPNNNARIVAPSDGLYWFALTITFTSNATGVRACGIRLDGNTNVLIGGAMHQAANGQATRISASALVQLYAGQYAELIAFQSSGTTLSAISGDSNTHFEWARLA